MAWMAQRILYELKCMFTADKTVDIYMQKYVFNGQKFKDNNLASEKVFEE